MNIKNLEAISLTDDDMIKYLPDPKIIAYPDLVQFSSLNQLLPRPRDYVVLLYQDSNENNTISGHWTCLIRTTPNTVLFFDSFGNSIDVDRKWLSAERLDMLGAGEPFLSQLIDKSNDDVYFNDFKYQSYDPNICTCGRHVVCFLLCVLKDDMDINDYNKFMKNMKAQHNKDYDEIVTILTS